MEVASERTEKEMRKEQRGHKQNIIQLTCLMAVTVMTKNKGKPLVTGLVGVSTITFKKKDTHNIIYIYRIICINIHALH